MSGSLRFLLERDRVVQAGAGTGKTHALLTQYLHLCAGLSAHHRAIPPQKICALTFTEKAAAEMRHKHGEFAPTRDFKAHGGMTRKDI